jgi:hypothetical protein
MRALLASGTLLLAVTTMTGFIPQATTTPQRTQNELVTELIKEARVALRHKDFTKSAQLLEEAVAKAGREPGLLYDTACSLALAGDKEKAFQFLFSAIHAGFYRTAHLKIDSDLDSLHDDARWAKAIAASDQQQVKFIKEHSDPNKARFITTDISRFWRAYDKAMRVAPKERAAILQREYIDRGTAGLKDFNRSGRLNAEGLAKAIESSPNFFKAIRPITTGIDRQRAEIIIAFRKLKELYPQAIFPDTYFLMGDISFAGTASGNGLLIGAEMFTRSPDIPTAELGDWERNTIMEQSEIPPVVAHEFIHFHQAYGSQESLLCKCLNEGSADFIGELISGRLITRTQKTHVWADAREEKLWEEFQKEMDGTDISHWLYAGSEKGDRPVDLGYWMGYKISEAYYRNAVEKKQAIKDILMVKDCKEFLNASHYADKFAGASRTQ